jgi:hypothetical protein
MASQCESDYAVKYRQFPSSIFGQGDSWVAFVVDDPASCKAGEKYWTFHGRPPVQDKSTTTRAAYFQLTAGPQPVGTIPFPFCVADNTAQLNTLRIVADIPVDMFKSGASRLFIARRFYSAFCPTLESGDQNAVILKREVARSGDHILACAGSVSTATKGQRLHDDKCGVGTSINAVKIQY